MVATVPAVGDPITASDADIVAGAVNTYLFPDVGWQTVTLAAGFAAVGTPVPSYRVIGLQVFWRGKVGPNGGGNLAVSTDNTVAAAGGVGSDGVPIGEVDRPCVGASAASVARCYVSVAGAVHVITSATATAYVDLGGLSGYLTN